MKNLFIPCRKLKVRFNLSKFCPLILTILQSGNPVFAQIVPDGTLGVESSTVVPNQIINDIPSSRIDGGAIRGVNLFHSFESFNVPDGQGVFFSDPTGVENILTRVTGAQASNVLGTLGVLGDANFFLINPNGLFFGSNARLNINGSFISTTASSIVFSDGGQFGQNTSSTTLTINTPIGLQFKVGNGNINLEQAELSVRGNTTLALIGGNLTFQGGLVLSEQGRIELGSIGDNGFVGLRNTSNGLVSTYDSVSSFRDIRLSQGAKVELSGSGEGHLNVYGQNIFLTEGSGIQAFSLGTTNRGNLLIRATESLEINGTGENGQFSGINAQVPLGTSGIGSNLTVDVKRLIVEGGAQISASTFGFGDAGNLTIRASESIRISENGVYSQVRENAIGNSGNINIETARLVIEDQAQISASTFGQGNAGNIFISASESVDVRGVERITFDRQEGLTQFFIRDFLNSRILAQANPGAIGESGNVTLLTDRLALTDGGQISVSNFAGSGAGLISIETQRAELNRGSGIFAQTTSGNGGDIRITAQDFLLLRGSSLITTEAGIAPGGGNGGNIEINARFLIATPFDRNRIIANAFLGSGGNIQINGEAIFGFDLEGTRSNSFISASSELGTSGTVLINSPFVEFSREFYQAQTDISPLDGLVELRCRSSGDLETGSFYIQNNIEIPPGPIEILEDADSSRWGSDSLIIEASGWIRDEASREVIYLIAQGEVSTFLRTTNSCYES